MQHVYFCTHPANKLILATRYMIVDRSTNTNDY